MVKPMPEGSEPQIPQLSSGRDKIAEALHAMVRGVIGSAGEPFFQSLSLTLARILEVKVTPFRLSG